MEEYPGKISKTGYTLIIVFLTEMSSGYSGVTVSDTLSRASVSP